MKEYRLTVRRVVSYTEYSDVSVEANSLDEAKEIAIEMAESGEFEFDQTDTDYGTGEYEAFSENEE